MFMLWYLLEILKRFWNNQVEWSLSVSLSLSLTFSLSSLPYPILHTPVSHSMKHINRKCGHTIHEVNTKASELTCWYWITISARWIRGDNAVFLKVVLSFITINKNIYIHWNKCSAANNYWFLIIAIYFHYYTFLKVSIIKKERIPHHATTKW